MVLYEGNQIMYQGSTHTFVDSNLPSYYKPLCIHLKKKLTVSLLCYQFALSKKSLFSLLLSILLLVNLFISILYYT